MTVYDEVIGQPDAVAVLSRASADAAEVLDGQPGPAMTHAWLITGPPGSGRSVAARAFAAALECPLGGCGDCDACRTSLGGTHADVTLVTPEGLSYGVTEARQLVRSVSDSPMSGRWRVVVVEDADRLTEDAANALLRAIEEPPRRAVFILCAPTPDDLLPTIRSRCRLVTLRIPSAEAVAAVLVRRDGIDPAMAAFAARAAQGHVGRARRLATDEEARRRRRDVLDLPFSLETVPSALAAAAALVEAATEEAVAVTDELDVHETKALREALGDIGRGLPRGSSGAVTDLEKRQKSRATRGKRDVLDRALLDLAALQRDVLAVQLGGRVALVNDDLADRVQRLAHGSRPEQTLRRIEAILACREALAANVNPLLAVEAMALAVRTG
ncbi:MAG: polymerase subunit delta [Frankiales bacterium]|jgi:DNA polymerase-3 subunit delta'|nr:polymerase subunit delta [Frankiales bacterium]